MQANSTRILVIDDNEDNASVTTEILELSGFAVFSADSGAQGIIKALQLHPEIVIVDIGMPDVNGFDVAKVLRSQISAPGFILIAYTGYSCQTVQHYAGKGDFDGVLQKPATIEKLLGMIDDLREVRGVPARLAFAPSQHC